MMIRALLLAGLAAGVATVAAGEPGPRAARSVHLAYLNPSDSAGYQAFYNECTIEQTVDGSYFQACGFAGGYFGVQDHGPRGRVAIFSAWDPPRGDDPDEVKLEDRVEILVVGEGVRAQRFGGEGTGAQSFLDYDWKVGQTLRFVVEATAENGRTTYAAYIQSTDATQWLHMATFRTHRQGLMTGLYAFIEDFRRDGESARQVRRATFGNGFVRDADGRWLALDRAKFTASGAEWEAKETINAGVAGHSTFFLQTGGETTMTSPLGKVLSVGAE